MIAAHPLDCLQIRIQFGVRDASIGAEIDALDLTLIARPTGFNTLSHPAALCKLPGPALPPPPEEVFSWGEFQRLVQANRKACWQGI
ncbi:MAG: hypothetical protein DLM68_16160 [Hyphomicrobiales bacterium]|nr:MAG: hypothetical protein DLM68_16160 [Hyphomicrobiales bacterium]